MNTNHVSFRIHAPVFSVHVDHVCKSDAMFGQSIRKPDEASTPLAHVEETTYL